STLERRVALKVLNANIATDERSLARFFREARSAAHVRHPHIINVFDCGAERGLCYLVMEFIEGQTFAEYLSSRGPLTGAETAAVLLPVAEAVAALHAAKILHRDLKPSNVLLATDRPGGPWPIVTDFGVSRSECDPALTTSDALLGTPAYVSPEVLRTPRSADARSDQYALGVMLYESSTVRGQQPVRAHARHRDEPRLATELAQRCAHAGMGLAGPESDEPRPGGSIPVDASSRQRAVDLRSGWLLGGCHRACSAHGRARSLEGVAGPVGGFADDRRGYLGDLHHECTQERAFSPAGRAKDPVGHGSFGCICESRSRDARHGSSAGAYAARRVAIDRRGGVAARGQTRTSAPSAFGELRPECARRRRTDTRPRSMKVRTRLALVAAFVIANVAPCRAGDATATELLRRGIALRREHRNE